MASVAGLLASSDQLRCTWNCILRVLGQEGQDIKLDKMEIIILVTFFWEITSNPFAKTPGDGLNSLLASMEKATLNAKLGRNVRVE